MRRSCRQSRTRRTYRAQVPDFFAALAAAHDLDDVTGRSPDGLAERYLYSQDINYRYAFARWWGSAELTEMDGWVLLNPATGDTELRRRPTLERCIARSRDDGRSGVLILNLFAYRDTKPAGLRVAADPIGPVNDLVLAELSRAVSRTIVAWGGGGSLLGRSSAVAATLENPLCLGTTAQGEPRHPLYLPSSTPLEPWPTA